MNLAGPNWMVQLLPNFSTQTSAYIRLAAGPLAVLLYSHVHSVPFRAAWPKAEHGSFHALAGLAAGEALCSAYKSKRMALPSDYCRWNARRCCLPAAAGFDGTFPVEDRQVVRVCQQINLTEFKAFPVNLLGGGKTLPVIPLSSSMAMLCRMQSINVSLSKNAIFNDEANNSA